MNQHQRYTSRETRPVSTYQTRSTRGFVNPDPVLAVVRVEVLAPIFVESTTAAHSDCVQ